MKRHEIASCPGFDHHERVEVRQGPVLQAIIAVHSTRLGPAVGGCRMHPYASTAEAMTDVLKLSRGMTYKAALAGVPLGGGKSVIIGSPQTDKTEELLHEMGKFVDTFGGTYVTAEDMGTSVQDVAVMGERTRFVSGLAEGEQFGGDPSPITALGVFQGIAAAVSHRCGTGLAGIRVGVQGVGKVGQHLVRLLAEAGAATLVADLSESNLQQVADLPRVEAVPCDKILFADVDVLAPSARGGIVNPDTVGRIKAGIIAGSANNQLSNPMVGWALLDSGILYAPDYVINAGGLIEVYHQLQGERDPAVIREHLNKVGETLRQIFKCADQERVPTSLVADRMAEEILSKARANPPSSIAFTKNG